MNRHRKLELWRLAGRLVEVVYALSGTLPRDEPVVATPNLRRAAGSVQNDIAEGNAKLGARGFRRYLDISPGSLAEVDSVVGQLNRMYRLDPRHVTEGERLRRQVTAGIFELLSEGAPSGFPGFLPLLPPLP